MKMQMNFQTKSFLLLCLLYIVKASMYSINNKAHLDASCGSSLRNSSCIMDPYSKKKICDIPSIFKPLFTEDFDEVDGPINSDTDCCCPTKLQFLRPKSSSLINTENKKKKLAFTECSNAVLLIQVGTCINEHSSCGGKCIQRKRTHMLLIEENGDYKFDQFELSSHCSCSA